MPVLYGRAFGRFILSFFFFFSFFHLASSSFRPIDRRIKLLLRFTVSGKKEIRGSQAHGSTIIVYPTVKGNGV